MLTFTWIKGKLIVYNRFSRSSNGVHLFYNNRRVTDWRGIDYYTFDKLDFVDVGSTDLTKILYGLE